METERLGEPLRNALLRRVDWRFLVRHEGAATTLCLASGRLAQGVELISYRFLRDSAEPGACDLSVVANPSRASLRAAWSALRPGGMVYGEWHFPLGGRRAVRRRLEQTGFTDVRLYWRWPSRHHAPPQVWLPLDAPAAVEHFMRTRSEGPRRRRRMFLQMVWRAAARFGVLVPLCAVAEKAGDDLVERPGSITTDEESRDVDELIRGGWGASGFGREPERLSWLLLTGGFRSINKVVGLAFADEPNPRIIVKFARAHDAEGPLRREAETLRSLEALRPELPGVPRVLFLGRRAGRLSVGESAMGGRPLLSVLDRDTYGVLASAVTTWLADLAGTTEAQPRAAWWPRLMEQRLEEFERTFGGGVGTDDLERARVIMSEVGELPLVCEHRDCSPWNILVGDGGQLAFLDWESSEPSGLPALDLIYFLTYAAFFVEGAVATGRTREAYARTLDPSTFTGAVVRDCERTYCEQVGLSHELLGPLRLLCWIVHSRSDYMHLELDGPGSPDPKALRGSLFLELWKEELVRARR